MNNKNINLLFQKDSVYDDILRRFQKSKYIQNPEEKAKEFRAFLSSSIAISSVGMSGVNMYLDLLKVSVNFNI